MITAWWVGLAFGADDVATAWYRWRTGQDDAAAELAAQLVSDRPDDLGVHRLHVGMQVLVGNGASVEAAYREAWGSAPDDPVLRTGLAMVVAQRREAQGGWCDEVLALVAGVPVTVEPPEGQRRPKILPFTEAYYWATVADRMRELRCQGTTDHAESELRRIAKDGGIAWADGVIARAAAGYLKVDLPKDLERLWDEHPEHLDQAALLWADNVSGPAKGGARSVANKALNAALEGDDPVAVHGALLAYRAMEKDKKIEAAVARLTELDPDADPDLVRSLDDIADPPIYGEIEACLHVTGGATGVLACLDELEVPETGPVAAQWHVGRRAAALAAGDLAGQLEAAHAAFVADPTHRFNARTYARISLAAIEVDPEPYWQAVEVVLEGRTGDSGVAETQASRVAADLDLFSRGALVTPERAGAAVEHAAMALRLAPSGARRILFGQVLAVAEQPDAAVVQLAYGVQEEVDDTSAITDGRTALKALAEEWGFAGGMPAMLDEIAREGDDAMPRHALVGQPFPDAALVPEGDIAVLLLWAGWHGDLPALQRLQGVGEHYADDGVVVRAVSVGIQEDAVPDDIEVDHIHAGPELMRAVSVVGLPAFVVVSEETVRVVRAPYDRSSLQLEDVLDDLVPE